MSKNDNKKIKNDNFLITISTFDEVNPKVIFIDGSAYITPMSKEDNYDDKIENIRLRFKEYTENFVKSLPDIINDNFIFTFNIATDRIKVNKKSKLTFQISIHVKKNEEFLKLCDEIKDEYDILFGLFLDTVIGCGFWIEKSKK